MGQWIVPHTAAIFAGALVMCTGLDLTASGFSGLISGPLKWLGGFLIWILVAGVSFPVGVILRWASGFLPFSERVGNVVVGSVVGFSIEPLLNSGFGTPTSLRVDSIAIMTVAGATGGWAWWYVEFGRKLQTESC